LIYAGIVLVYAGFFLGFICPVCGTRHVCPGGQVSTRLRKTMGIEDRGAGGMIR
jgi:hypothetical protein